MLEEDIESCELLKKITPPLKVEDCKEIITPHQPIISSDDYDEEEMPKLFEDLPDEAVID